MQPDIQTAADFAGGPGVIFANSDYADFVSGSWLTKVRSRELERLAGNYGTNKLSYR